MGSEISGEFVTLARLALSEKTRDVHLLVGKVARKYQSVDAEFSDNLTALLKDANNRSVGIRRDSATPIPVDSDSRLHLIRVEEPSSEIASPIFSPEVGAKIKGILRERAKLDVLTNAGLDPTRTVLFVGPPGVGKTLSARWIASQLSLKLLILDLSAVMSSFLGRTGNNVRSVLDYAKQHQCVLLLDEFDAIAKRRDDSTEIGELKRLVTVLLQEIDEWPSSGMLIAATNHADLLDTAVWRRFDQIIEFKKPAITEVREATAQYLYNSTLPSEWVNVLTMLFSDHSFSDIERSLRSIRRNAALSEKPVEEAVTNFVASWANTAHHKSKLNLATALCNVPSLSQRRIAEITGISRDTIRNHSTKSSKELIYGRSS
jgi:SpoVK/Ycf46/Vps4 family AAA+-type ATPase